MTGVVAGGAVGTGAGEVAGGAVGAGADPPVAGTATAGAGAEPAPAATVEVPPEAPLPPADAPVAGTPGTPGAPGTVEPGVPAVTGGDVPSVANAASCRSVVEMDWRSRVMAAWSAAICWATWDAAPAAEPVDGAVVPTAHERVSPVTPTVAAATTADETT